MALRKDDHEKIIQDKIDGTGLNKKPEMNMASGRVLKRKKNVNIIFKMNSDDKALFEQYVSAKGSTLSNEMRVLIYELLRKQGLK
jgi:hypothetical protein